MRNYDAAEATAYLHQHIPVTRAMQIEVLPPATAALTLEAKLAPNLNHQETAFGGSIASLGILAGWTLIHLQLHGDGHRYQIVIQRSEMEFLKPIEADFQAECSYPDESVWEQLYAGLDRKGRARLELESSVILNGETAARIQGTFVIKRLSTT